MSSESVVHIKFEYDEALRAKKEILYSELNALNIEKKIANYREIRMEEFALKTRLYWKLKDIKKNIRKLQIFLPSAKKPAILKKHEKEEKHVEKETLPKENLGKTDIESQLREIQKRLERLQGGS